MPKRLLQALAVLVVSSSPLAAQTMSIDHSAVGCVPAGKFPRLDARFVPGDAVGKARVFFQTTDAKRWYAVTMKPEAGAFSGVLPKPKKSLQFFRYYIEVTDKSLATSRTPEYTTSVVDGAGGCKGKMMGGGLASAAVTLEVPAGAPAVPAGFSSSGLTAVGVAGAAVATGAAVAGQRREAGSRRVSSWPSREWRRPVRASPSRSAPPRGATRAPGPRARHTPGHSPNRGSAPRRPAAPAAGARRAYSATC
jgi:hypothetical protein